MTEAAPEGALAPTPPTAWGRKASRGYLLTGGLALAWMGIEWALGSPGPGTILAAILSLPWSFLIARMAPPFLATQPMTMQFAFRFGSLALLMLLNAAIVHGIAGRFERDLAKPPLSNA